MNNNGLKTANEYNEASRDEKTRKIILKIQQGDTELEQKFAEANKKFVAKIAEPYGNKGISILDLVKDGMQGIVKAAHKYDTASDFTFNSYAQWWVKQEILQAFNAKGLLDEIKQ